MEHDKSNPNESNSAVKQKIDYPRLIERVKALIIDGFILVPLIILAGYLFSFFEDAPGYLRGAVFVLILFLYEPILVSFGGTIGHRVMGMKVKSNSNRNKNLFFLLAIFRSAVKYILGWISLLTILMHKENRAMHDLFSNSIMLYREEENS